jgi:hypothetical protein
VTIKVLMLMNSHLLSNAKRDAISVERNCHIPKSSPSKGSVKIAHLKILLSCSQLDSYAIVALKEAIMMFIE